MTLVCPSCKGKVLASRFVEIGGSVACSGYCIDMAPNISESKAAKLVAEQEKLAQVASISPVGSLSPATA